MRQLRQSISVLASLLAFWAQSSLSHIPGATCVAEHGKQYKTSQGSLTQQALQVRQTETLVDSDAQPALLLRILPYTLQTRLQVP